MSDWWVVSPEYGWTEIIVDGQGPTHYERDVVLISAETAADAKALGVRWWLDHPRDCHYLRDVRLDGANPYAGVYVEEAPDE